MTKEEIETLIDLEEKLSKKSQELFSYIYNTYNDVLEFARDSCYNHCEINKDTISIEYYDYGYDRYDSREIEISISDFVSDPFKWADNWANDIYAEEKKKEEAAEKRKEEREREVLRRLKEKYEI